MQMYGWDCKNHSTNPSVEIAKCMVQNRQVNKIKINKTYEPSNKCERIRWAVETWQVGVAEVLSAICWQCFTRSWAKLLEIDTPGAICWLGTRADKSCSLLFGRNEMYPPGAICWCGKKLTNNLWCFWTKLHENVPPRAICILGYKI